MVTLTGGILADGDLGIAQGIGGAIGLDLVDDFLELEGQVLGEGAGFLPGQDLGQIFSARSGGDGHHGGCGAAQQSGD